MNRGIKLFIALFCLCCPQLSLAAVDTSVGRSDVLTYTGSYNFSVPIPAPAGGAGVQPALSLNYSSGQGNGLYGEGWDLSVARIERSLKAGRPNYTNSDTFVLYMNGSAQTLVNVGGDEYRTRIEGAFFKFIKAVDHWVVYDKNGTSYFFGLDNVNQLSRWPATAAEPFSWNLSKVVNPRGNLIHYYYDNDANGQRLIRVEYSPNNQVHFEYEARSDIRSNNVSGHTKTIGVRLKRVYSTANGALAFDQELVYSSWAVDGRSLLARVINHPVSAGPEDQERVFTYDRYDINTLTQNWMTSVLSTYISNPAYRAGNRMNQVPATMPLFTFDYDGNGYNDSIFTTRIDGVATKLTLGLYGVGTTYFTFPAEGATYSAIGWIDYRKRVHYLPRVYPRAWIDMNGDGMMDWVVKDANANFEVRFSSTGMGGWSAPEVWADPATGEARKDMSFFDVNGDGLPDRVVGATAWLNNGNGFSGTMAVSAPGGANAVTAVIPGFSPRYPITWDGNIGGEVYIYATNQWSSAPLMASAENVNTGAVQSFMGCRALPVHLRRA